MKKLLSSLSLAALLLAGCSSSNDTEKETFVVGMECNYAPFNYQLSEATDDSVSLGGAGYCSGYDVLIAKKIANDLDLDLEIKKISWEGLLPALNSGEIDAIIAGMTANEEREQGADFTTPYYESEMVMIVRKNDEVASYDDIQQFSNKTVIGQLGTNYDTIIDQIENVNHATPKKTYPEMVVALQKNEVDGITAELPVAKSVVEANSDLAIVHFAEGKGFDIDTTVSIGLKEGTRGTEFFNKVQASLDSISSEQRVDWMQQATDNAPASE